MRIERGASNTFTLAARPTLTPSEWLLKFVKIDGGLTILCIADATPVEGEPMQLTFIEQDATPDPLAGEVTLPVGQWQLTVYEQSSTTNLNWTLAARSPFTALVEVVGAATPDPPPTDPCSGDCPDICELLTDSEDPITYSACIPDEFAPAVGNQMLLRDSYTADLIVEGIGNAGKTNEVCALLPCADVPCPLDINVNGDFLATVDDPCSTPSVNYEVVDSEGNPASTSIAAGKIVVNDLPCAVVQQSYYWRAITLGT